MSENIVNSYAAVSSVSETIRKNSESMETLSAMVKEIRGMSDQLHTLAK